jgi:hypothetical protein
MFIVIAISECPKISMTMRASDTHGGVDRVAEGCVEWCGPAWFLMLSRRAAQPRYGNLSAACTNGASSVKMSCMSIPFCQSTTVRPESVRIAMLV